MNKSVVFLFVPLIKLWHILLIGNAENKQRR